MKIYQKSDIPKRDEEDCSVDVITYDQNGMLNIGYFDFELNHWSFHTDTLVDLKDKDFVWMYAPEELLNALKEKPAPSTN
jgi:hypothetical protein